MIKEFYKKIIINNVIYFVSSFLFLSFIIMDFMKIKDESLNYFILMLISISWVVFSISFIFLLYQNFLKSENKLIAKFLPFDIFNTKPDKNFVLNLIKNYYQKNKENIKKIEEQELEVKRLKDYLNENNKFLKKTFLNFSDKLNLLENNNVQVKNNLNIVKEIYNNNLKLITEMEDIIQNNLNNKIINSYEKNYISNELNSIKEININNILLILTLMSDVDVNLKRKIIQNLENNIQNLDIIINSIIKNYELKLNNLNIINSEYQNIISKINNKLYILKNNISNIENKLNRIFDLIEKTNNLIKETKILINEQIETNKKIIKKYQLESFISKEKNKIPLNI